MSQHSLTTVANRFTRVEESEGTFDTNILLWLAVVSHPTNADAALAVYKIRQRGDQPVIVPQVLYEYWVVATRPAVKNGLGLKPADARLAIDEFLKSIVLLRDERGIFANWLADVTDLAISGKRAHDARLVAAMQRHGLQQIVTFNKSDFNDFPNISVFLPHEVA